MAKQGAQGLKKWAFPAIIIAVALLLIATVVVQEVRAPGEQAQPAQSSPATQPEGTTQPEGAQTQEEVDLSDLERRDPDDLLSAGAVDAPVALVAYSDYQCPYCGQWSHETLPTMMEYVEAGQLRIEWRDVEVFGPESGRAARAAYAAALQDGFWEYHDALFPGGEHRPKTELTDEALVSLAGELGLDEAQFEQDLNSDAVVQETQRNAMEAINLGVTATPAFILGGQPILGAQPTEVFVEAMETALAEAEG